MSASPVVSLVRAESYEMTDLRSQVEAVLAPLGGMAAFVKPGDRVLLKPNLLTGARPGQECITRPELVAVVATLVRAAGGLPFIGDSPAFGTAAGVIKANGYAPLMEAMQLPVVELHGQRYEIDHPEFGHLRLSKEVMAADVVINLPKVKSHLQLTVTLAVKNLFGCVPGKMKAWWHMEAGQDRDRFGAMLVETARAINPELTLVDGIIGHEGNGPSGGTPRPLGVLAAGTNVFALDQVLAYILGVDPESVPTLVAATQLGYDVDWATIDFPLLTPAELRVSDWQLPDQLMAIDFGLPRVVRSTFKHFYIRFIKEPMSAYARRAS